MIKDYDKTIDIIVSNMKKQAKRAGTNKAEVDISGGVDSAVVVALACKAFGPDNVIGVYSSIDSSTESYIRALSVANKFDFKLICLSLTDVFNDICNKVEQQFSILGIPWPSMKENPTVFGSLRSCLRAPIGRFVNRAFMGGIRQGTGNMDEDELVRFYQKGGDGEVDANWIGCLYKSEVWQLAEYLEVPKEIIEAKPTPDLWGVGDEHNDEDELSEWAGVPLTYGRPDGPMGMLEWVSRENAKYGWLREPHVEDESEGVPSLDELMSGYGYTEEQAKTIISVMDIEEKTRHKGQMPPSIPRWYLIYEDCVE